MWRYSHLYRDECGSKIGIALGLENDRVAQAIKEHPDAKAILINNPTYYGICSDLKGLTEMAHAAGMKV